MELEELGWNDFFQGQFETIGEELVRARVRRQDAGGYQLIAESGDLQAVLTGKFRHQANSKADLPTVGDWVLVETLPNEPGKGIIRYLLTRRSKFSRKEAGHQVDEQVVAANIDTVFIVCGLDGDLNPRRIERYLTTTWDSGAVPVIILSKSDVCTDLESQMDEVSKVSISRARWTRLARSPWASTSSPSVLSMVPAWMNSKLISNPVRRLPCWVRRASASPPSLTCYLATNDSKRTMSGNPTAGVDTLRRSGNWR